MLEMLSKTCSKEKRKTLKINYIIIFLLLYFLKKFTLMKEENKKNKMVSLQIEFEF